MIMLYIALFLLFCSAMVFIFLPLYAGAQNFKENKNVVVLFIGFLAIMSSVLYYFIGDSRGVYNKIFWQELEIEHIQKREELQVPIAFIDSLVAQLERHPNNGLNWVLLGRIYFAGQDYHDATIAFAQAYALYPNDPDILVEYATARYLAGENAGKDWDKLISAVSALSPQTTISLSLLANIAFSAGDKAQAITYWQMILNMTPAGSPFYQTLQQTIADVSAN